MQGVLLDNKKSDNYWSILFSEHVVKNNENNLPEYVLILAIWSLEKLHQGSHPSWLKKRQDYRERERERDRCCFWAVLSEITQYKNKKNYSDTVPNFYTTQLNERAFSLPFFLFSFLCWDWGCKCMSICLHFIKLYNGQWQINSYNYHPLSELMSGRNHF